VANVEQSARNLLLGREVAELTNAPQDAADAVTGIGEAPAHPPLGAASDGRLFGAGQPPPSSTHSHVAILVIGL
jgi:hypothetical protein